MFPSFAAGIGGWCSSTLPINRRAAAVSTKEVGVNCVPMCRDVGVTTTQAPVASSSVSASTSTMTERVSGTATAACTGKCGRPPPSSAAASTQTMDAVVKTSAITQTSAAAAVVRPATTAASTQTAAPAAVVEPKPTAMDTSTQTMWPAVRTVAVGVTVRPRTYDASVTVKPTVKHVGCTADLLQRGTDVVQPAVVAAAPRVPVTRTTQTDAAATPPVRHARATQTAVGRATTQTDDDQAASDRKQRDRQGEGRPWAPAATIGRRSNSFHHYTTAAVDAATKSPPTTTATTPPSPVVTSKIPRLKPVTPELNRKVLTRQDTYTKTAAEICSDQPPPSVTDDEDGNENDDDDQLNVK